MNAPPKRPRTVALRAISHTASAPSNPHPATDAPAPVGSQRPPASSPTMPPAKYSRSHWRGPNNRSTSVPTTAIAEKLKPICLHPPECTNSGVISLHHCTAATPPGTRSNAGNTDGETNCDAVTTPVTPRTQIVAHGILLGVSRRAAVVTIKVSVGAYGAGGAGLAGFRGNMSGSCAVLYAKTASTCAPSVKSSQRTRSSVSACEWCVLS